MHPNGRTASLAPVLKCSDHFPRGKECELLAVIPQSTFVFGNVVALQFHVFMSVCSLGKVEKTYKYIDETKIDRYR